MLPTGTGFSYSCFNCGHTASFTLGRPLAYKARQLLSCLGLDQSDLAFINLESLRQRELGDLLLEQTKQQPKIALPTFSTIRPPPGDILNPLNSAHKPYVDYITNRGLDPFAYPYLVDLDADRAGITIPFTHNGHLVGYTTRYFDNKKPKYNSEQQTGYVFGIDLQRPEWNFALLMEGPFCALSLNGLGVMHQVASPEQCVLIESLEKEIVVVPDQNKSGFELIDQAIERNWSVSIPNWHTGIEDVNEAVKAYGKVGTLLSILETRESNELKIKLRRKWLANKLRE